MRILKLTAEHVKRLKVVEITPKGDVVTISGKNASGKTSLLDSIYMALAGKSAIPSQPIHTGCDRARIELDLGAITVERRFTASGTTVTVTNAEGASYKSPQKMLDDLLGSLSFDPLQFSRMDARTQYATLRNLVKLDVDIDALDAANKADYDARTEINRQTKQLTARAEAIAVVAAEPVDEVYLLDAIEKAGQVNADIQKRQQNRDKALQTVSDLAVKQQKARDKVTPTRERAVERISELERQIRTIREEMEAEVSGLMTEAQAAVDEADALKARLAAAPPLPTPVVISDLRAQLDAARVANAAVARLRERDALLLESQQSEAISQGYTAAIAAREKQKSDAIAAADMPVPDLSFGDGAVLYRGLPFDQASSAEQLRVSTSIAMALNPKLRVIRIKDGGLLDDDGLALLGQMAAEKDFQVWLESVKSDDPAAIIMEDGAIKAA
jgi:DNA repair exonuclease SbcCD ATPase subunit